MLFIWSSIVGSVPNLSLSLIGIILRWGFLIWELIFHLLWTFCPHLGSCCVVSFSLRFGQISSLALFRWLTANSERLITWRRPEVKFCRNVVKKKQHKNYQDDKKSAINEKIIFRLRSLISKWFQFKAFLLVRLSLIWFYLKSNFSVNYICRVQCRSRQYTDSYVNQIHNQHPDVSCLYYRW